MTWLKRFIARPWITIVMMTIYTMLGKPYFKVFIFQTDRVGNVAIDSHYNIPLGHSTTRNETIDLGL